MPFTFSSCDVILIAMLDSMSYEVRKPNVKYDWEGDYRTITVSGTLSNNYAETIKSSYLKISITRDDDRIDRSWFSVEENIPENGCIPFCTKVCTNLDNISTVQVTVESYQTE